MPMRKHKKLFGMPRSKKGSKFLVIKGKKNWLVLKIKKKRGRR